MAITGYLMPPFNDYLNLDRMAQETGNIFEIKETVHFVSTYYVDTRVFKPLLTQLLDKAIDIKNLLMEWNHFLSQLRCCGDYGTNNSLCW